MRDSVWLRAAQRIALTPEEYKRDKTTREGCCAALTKVGATDVHHDRFAHVFNPEGRVGYWWRIPLTRKKSWPDQQARVLALLFMHWMTESGDA